MNTDLMGILVNGIVTVVVALIGLQQRASKRDNDKYREMREQLEKEKEDKLMKEKQEEEKRLISIETSIQGLSKDMNKLQETVKTLSEEQFDDIKDQLKNLHTMESNNFVYIRSLSNVVVNIGEVLNGSTTIDEKAKDKLDECIDQHKKKETDIHEMLIKLIM